MPNLLSSEPPKKRRVTLLDYYHPVSQLEVIEVGTKQSVLENLPTQEQSQVQKVLHTTSVPNSSKSLSAQVRPPNYQKLLLLFVH
ncbi:hypothetical protein P9112_010182 [Eukaryota sp. TZLM1-RC]